MIEYLGFQAKLFSNSLNGNVIIMDMKIATPIIYIMSAVYRKSGGAF